MSGSTWQGTGLVVKGPVNQENSREVQCLESELIMKIKAPQPPMGISEIRNGCGIP